jgi:hypothetical protein
MEGFIVKGEGDLIEFIFEEVYRFPETTCHWGGYEVRSILKIKSGNFIVKSILFTSTGEIHEFFLALKKCNEELKGVAYYRSYENNLDVQATYDNLGHVNIKGAFSENNQFGNKLIFEFNTDQTFINETLRDLSLLENKYGGMKGIKK